jgi:predicted lipoprotein with Yx(FWY)xxD motif
MRRIRLADNHTSLLWLGAAAAAILVTACGGTTGSGSGAGSGGPATISAAQTSAGMVLTGPTGNTVYTLLDAQGKPLPCTGACPAVWPSVATSGNPQAGSGVTATLATASSSDGSTQASANGAPLYYYSGDSAAGQVNGQGLMSFGGTWHALQPNGQAMTSSGGATPTTPGGYGGGGY